MNKPNIPIRTMQEFSEYVGVSRPTVSKFFNDPASVKKNTREKLEKATKALNFQPNMLAVNFRKKQTNLVGVIIPDATDPFYAALIQQVSQILHEKGLIAMVLSSGSDNGLQSQSIATIMGMQVAGLIFVPTMTEGNEQEISHLVESIPTVFVDAYDTLTNHFVGNDNTQSITLIVEYLVRSGSPPCFFPVPKVNSTAAFREKAYRSVMHTLNCEPQIIPVDDSYHWDFESWAYQQTEALLKAGGFPSDTVLCGSDRIAYGVMAACHAAHLTIGRGETDDLRVAGHDDHPLSRYVYPPLTTVRQDTAGIASMAANKLLHMMESKTPPRPEKILLQSTLQLRLSA